MNCSSLAIGYRIYKLEKLIEIEKKKNLLSDKRYFSELFDNYKCKDMFINNIYPYIITKNIYFMQKELHKLISS